MPFFDPAVSAAAENLTHVTPEDETAIAEYVPDQTEAFALCDEALADVEAMGAPPDRSAVLKDATRQFLIAAGRVVYADKLAEAESQRKQAKLNEWSTRLADQSQLFEEVMRDKENTHKELEKCKAAQETLKAANAASGLFSRLKDQHDEVRRLKDLLSREEALLANRSCENSTHLDDDALEALESAEDDITPEEANVELATPAHRTRLTRRRSTLNFVQGSNMEASTEIETKILRVTSSDALNRTLNSLNGSKFRAAYQSIWEKVSAKLAIESATGGTLSTDLIEDYVSTLSPTITEDSHINTVLQSALRPVMPSPTPTPTIVSPIRSKNVTPSHGTTTAPQPIPSEVEQRRQRRMLLRAKRREGTSPTMRRQC